MTNDKVPENQVSLKDVLAFIKKQQLVFFSTVDGDQPKVRPVTLHFIDNKYWIVTNSLSAKVKQLQGNPKVEVCIYLENKEYQFGSGYIRAEGTADIVQDMDVKFKVGMQTGLFHTFYKGADDPTYTLLDIHIKNIEYLRLPDFKPHRFTL
jgi:general stress protein 26